MSGMVSSIDPVMALHWPRPCNANTKLRSDPSAASYSDIASANRRCARSTWPLAKRARELSGDAAKA
jgi:hypothetical protein